MHPAARGHRAVDGETDLEVGALPGRAGITSERRSGRCDPLLTEHGRQLRERAVEERGDLGHGHHTVDHCGGDLGLVGQLGIGHGRVVHVTPDDRSAANSSPRLCRGASVAGWIASGGGDDDEVMRLLSLVLTTLAVLCVVAPGASAHTESDFVAVPAGEQATVKLRPTHGCGESPTVKVSIRTDVAGAVGGVVEGWTSTATPDAEGRTVIEWTGGSLPADEAGQFPITFTVPGAVGELLVFPAVQECANGESLAWIEGDPNGEFPAPRLLILAAGSEPAATIDEVPADAPGREQLVAFVDVDNPLATTTTAAPTTTTEAPTTTVPTEDEETAAAADEDSSSGWVLPVVIVVVVVVAAAGGALVWVRRRRT